MARITRSRRDSSSCATLGGGFYRSLGIGSIDYYTPDHQWREVDALVVGKPVGIIMYDDGGSVTDHRRNHINPLIAGEGCG